MCVPDILQEIESAVMELKCLTHLDLTLKAAHNFPSLEADSLPQISQVLQL